MDPLTIAPLVTPLTYRSVVSSGPLPRRWLPVAILSILLYAASLLLPVEDFGYRSIRGWEFLKLMVLELVDMAADRRFTLEISILTAALLCNILFVSSSALLILAVSGRLRLLLPVVVLAITAAAGAAILFGYVVARAASPWTERLLARQRVLRGKSQLR
jgi:hypothetical protein